MMNKKIAIIGGGITGLSAAWSLKKNNCEVTLFEKDDQTGGSIRSIKEEGFLFETGPNSMQINDKRILDIIDDIGVDAIDANSDAANRFIVRYKKPIAAPSSLASAITCPLFCLKAKLRVAIEPFIRKGKNPDESLADFVTRRIGHEFLDYAINPMVGGIYAGDPKLLSTRLAFPKVYALEQNYGSLVKGAIHKIRNAKNDKNRFKTRLVSFKNGMGELSEGFHQKVKDSVLTNVTINDISHENGWHIKWMRNGEKFDASFDSIILALPTHKFQTLPVERSLESTLKPLTDIHYAPVSSVIMGFNREQITHPLNGFGMLVPEKENMNILGTLFTSSLFSNRAPDGSVCLTTFAGGSRQPEIAALPIKELTPIILKDLNKLIGLNGEPTITRHFHWPKAIPQYILTYQKNLDIMSQAEKDHPGLYFAGNYRHGISVGQCMLSGANIAEKVMDAKS